jgi:putative oxidoreductase
VDWVLLIGRIVFVAVFVISGVSLHLLKWRQGVAYASQYGVPAVLVPLSGLVAVGGGVLLALGLWPDLGALLIAVFAFPVALWMHAFWKVTDPMMRMNDQAHFMKDLGLGGAALALFAFFQQFGDEVGLTLTGPLF